MLKKIALNLNYGEMKDMYTKIGEQDFIRFLSEIINEKPRITKDLEILKRITNYLKNMT